jgi:hypothetical protein
MAPDKMGWMAGGFSNHWVVKLESPTLFSLVLPARAQGDYRYTKKYNQVHNTVKGKGDS